MTNDGWIRLHRSIADSAIWHQPPAHFKLWCHLLLLATYEDYKGLKPGQCRVSLRYLAQDVGVSRTTVIRALEWLEQEKMITRIQGKGTSQTVVSISNWKRYQTDEVTGGSGPASGPVATPQGSPVGSPHYKKGKKGKKGTALDPDVEAWARDTLNQYWVLAGRELSKTQETPTAKAKMIEAVALLHTKDGHSRQDVQRVLHAVASSGFRGIGSPVSLRNKLSNDGTITQFEYQLSRLKEGVRDQDSTEERTGEFLDSITGGKPE